MVMRSINQSDIEQLWGLSQRGLHKKAIRARNDLICLQVHAHGAISCKHLLPIVVIDL